MPSWQQLRDVKLSEYEDAADGWGKASSRANADKDRVDNQILAKIRGSQTGMAASSAISNLEDLSRNYQYLHTECGLIRTALNGLATELAAPQRRLKQALEDAESLKFTIHPDGSVDYPATPSFVQVPSSGVGRATPGAPVPFLPGQAEGGVDPNKGKAEEIAEKIAEAVRDAAEVDSRYASVLGKLKARPGLKVDAADLLDAAQDTRDVQKAAGKYAGADKIPTDKSPEQNAAWWKGLTQEQRDEYATLYPAAIGALDGIPSPVRDDANRMVLAEAKSQYEADLKAIPAEPSPKFVSHGARGDMVYSKEWLEWHNKDYAGQKAKIEGRLKGMEAIEQRFKRSADSNLPEAYLLKFNAELDDGRVVLANGNPDTADHTSVYVPGTKSKLPDIGKDLLRSEKLWDASNSAAPGEKISTITWFDYNAPNDIPQATAGGYAEQGGPTLQQFMQGQRAAHQEATGTASHTTVMGHSYGSTVVGVATQSGTWRDGAMADEIIAIGSPGMQVDRAIDLGLKPGHVWAMGGSGDDMIVRHGGRLVGLGDDWNIPTDEDFGGKIMKSDSSNHGGFWEDPVSLRNQAAVITGKYDRTVLE
ncbi:alpha/beta hydrolase [Streptomyces sp. G-G2]|uniref:alpha/beta hydrolase n=1 Tax=Streptomyces sp. G-G2 TaxID=3046201 RepID=UPI0024B93D93|nr:alpha/beta hydrolase [Streptomyces sp. G-G2]MDJ0380711.1 alpha/beta hydrolase [Streptomyces sp. G-G2]